MFGGSLEPQHEPGETLRQRIVQLARHTLALGGDREVLDLARVLLEPAIRITQLARQLLRALARFNLASVEEHGKTYEDERGERLRGHLRYCQIAIDHTDRHQRESPEHGRGHHPGHARRHVAEGFANERSV